MRNITHDEFVSEASCRPLSVVCSALCFRAEGGQSGRNSTTDQRQTQATSQEGPVVGSDGSINTGVLTEISTGWGSSINVTDQGAVDRAFGFAEGVIEQVGQVLAGNAATTATTVAANTASLKTYADALSANTATGAAANTNKTLLYLGIAAAVVAAIFLFRR